MRGPKVLKPMSGQLSIEGLDKCLNEVDASIGSARDRSVARKRIEVARDILINEPGQDGLAFLHSGLCQTCLPHTRLKENHAVWTRSSGRFTLMVQPGIIKNKDKDGNVLMGSSQSDYIGVPYGTKARLIMLYLQTEGLKSQTVELGPSQTAFIRSLGLPVNGGPRGSIAMVREQTMRISRCNFVMQWDDIAEDNRTRQTIIDARITEDMEFWSSEDGGWEGAIKLNDRFHQHLLQHSVPLDKRAIAHLSGSSLSLDLYSLLAYRLPRLNKELYFSWQSLQHQIGAEFNRAYDLRKKTMSALHDVLAVYPNANVEVVNGGLLLKPSESAVKKTTVRGITLDDEIKFARKPR